MKRFIIIITVSFLIGISWGGFGSQAYAYEDMYEKVWDSGIAISNPVYDVEVGDTGEDGKPGGPGIGLSPSSFPLQFIRIFS